MRTLLLLKPINERKKQKYLVKNSKIQFDITLQKFNHFYDLNKKIPSEKSKNIDEKKLGNWYSNNLHYYRHNINYNHKEEFEKLLTNINMPFIIM